MDTSLVLQNLLSRRFCFSSLWFGCCGSDWRFRPLPKASFSLYLLLRSASGVAWSCSKAALLPGGGDGSAAM